MNRATHPVAATAIDLPEWAQGHETLLAAIIAQRPEIDVFDNGMSRFGGERFEGRNAAKLRRIHGAWVSQRIAGSLGPDEYEAMRAEVIATPDADQLIRRLLAGAML